MAAKNASTVQRLADAHNLLLPSTTSAYGMSPSRMSSAYGRPPPRSESARRVESLG